MWNANLTLFSYLSFLDIVVINCRVFQCPIYFYTALDTYDREATCSSGQSPQPQPISIPDPPLYSLLRWYTVNWSSNRVCIQKGGNATFYVILPLLRIMFFCVCLMRRNVLTNALFICRLTTNIFLLVPTDLLQTQNVNYCGFLIIILKDPWPSTCLNKSYISRVLCLLLTIYSL